MRRVLALLGALCMIGAALLARSAFDGDDDGGDGPGPGGGGDRWALLCAEELTDVCRALEDEGLADIEIEPVGETVDRLSATDAELDVDAWLTLDPFSTMVDERREFASTSQLFGEPEATGWSTGLAIAGFTDRMDALTEDCGGEVTWACLGDSAGDPWAAHGGEAAWGTVKPGYDPPDRSGAGLLVLTQAMASHLEAESFASQDIDNRWLRDLEEAVPRGSASPVIDTLVTQGPAAYGAVGTLGFAAEAAADADRGQGLVITYPAPMFRASVVLAPRRGLDVDELAESEALAAALTDAGWEQGEEGVPLPPAGVIDALRSAWEEAS